MKKLVAGLLALSLFLVACGQDSDQQKDSSRGKDDKAKTEQQSKKTNDSSKDKKDNKDDNKDANKDNKDNSVNDNQQQSNSNATNNDQNQTNNNQSNSGQTTSNQRLSYVVPYYEQSAAPVARQIYSFNGSKSQALRQLPNFQTTLNIANNKANKFGNGYEVYSGCSIKEYDGNHRYAFSFKDPNINGKCSIMTINYTGQAMVTNPNYQQ